MSTGSPGVGTGPTTSVRPSPPSTDQCEGGPAIWRTAARSFTEITTWSGHSRPIVAPATKGSDSTRAAVAPGLTDTSGGCPARPAAATIAAVLVWGWEPSTVTTRTLNQGVWRTARPAAATNTVASPATTQYSRRRPRRRATSMRRWRIRGSMARRRSPGGRTGAGLTARLVPSR